MYANTLTKITNRIIIVYMVKKNGKMWSPSFLYTRDGLAAHFIVAYTIHGIKKGYGLREGK